MTDPTSRPYRGRFAPSPTGPLHFGSLIAATGSYLQARSQQGEWWLRIEDIDPPREMPGAADDIIATLAEFGFEWDRLVYQSQRSALYQEALHSLQQDRLTYPCRCSRSDIANVLRDSNGPLIYPGTCRHLHFPLRERHAIRIRTDAARVTLQDRIQGEQEVHLAREVGDFVLRRADELYSYQLAVAVDDADQGMREVIRGADLLDSTPRQIHVQQQLGLPSPAYGHLPVATNAQGQKLSKQTFASPVRGEPPVGVLTEVLQFLGQNPPAELARLPLPEFWDWAIRHWDLAAVPRTPALTREQARLSV